MSGKKEWQVASVLNETEKIQTQIMGDYETNIKDNLNKTTKLNNEIEEMAKLIRNFELKNIEKISKELPDEAEKIVQNLTTIKNSLSDIKLSDVNFYLQEITTISNQLHKYQQQAQKLRQTIRNNPHYLDDEYNQAQNIRKNLISLRDKLRNLKNEVESKYIATTKIYQNIDSQKQNLKDIQTQNKNLLDQANKIEQIRNQANELKSQIKKEFESLDMKKAKKFTLNEYNKLSVNIEQFLTLSDEKVIKNYQKIYGDVTSIKDKYNNLYNEFIAKKRYSESLFNEIKYKNENNLLNFVKDLFKKDAKKVSKLSYYDKYKNTHYTEEFHQLLDKASLNIAQENFDEANEILNKARELYEKVSDEVDIMRENMEAGAKLTIKIREIMLNDINFRKASINFIDGNPINGFELYCQNGDTINFEEIKFEDGNLVVNLDHTQNSNQACNVRWENLQKVFIEKGIPITDVTKNGHSILKKTKKTKTAKDTQNATM